MAKKKGGNKGGNSKPAAKPEESNNSGATLETENSVVEPTSEATSAEPSSNNLEALAAQPEQPQQAPSSNNNVSAEGDAALREELQAAKAKIAALEAKVSSLTEENQRLRSSATSQPAAPAIDPARAGHLEQLQKRIESLKAEQAEADAAREAAWRQLKTAVADIARLAAPDAIKASTPTAAGAAA